MKQEFREPPDLPKLFTALAQHGLRYVLFGSGGFMAYGLQTASGDLDICIDPAEQNLRRLSMLFREVRAKPRYVPGWSEKEECERWQPEPLVVETFDHLFTTRYGDLDIVPFPYGPHGKEDRFTFASLDMRAITKAAFGQQIRVAHLDVSSLQNFRLGVKKISDSSLRSSNYRNFRRKANAAAGFLWNYQASEDNSVAARGFRARLFVTCREQAEDLDSPPSTIASASLALSAAAMASGSGPPISTRDRSRPCLRAP